MQGAIRNRITELGLDRQCAGLTILPISIAEIIAERDRHRPAIVTAIRACFERENAEAVLLGGAPFAGLARRLSEELGQTVLDGVEASILGA
jgi:Asp/Glu/hydantoin racemase